MAKGLPAELAQKLAANREATRAPSGASLTGNMEVRKRAAAKARKAKEAVFKK